MRTAYALLLLMFIVGIVAGARNGGIRGSFDYGAAAGGYAMLGIIWFSVAGLLMQRTAMGDAIRTPSQARTIRRYASFLMLYFSGIGLVAAIFNL